MFVTGRKLKIQRLIERGMIHFKDDPESEGSGGGSVSDEAAAADAAEAEGQAAEAAKAGAEGDKSKGDGEKLTSTERQLLAESMSRKEKLKAQREQMDALQKQMEEAKAQLETYKSTLGDTDLDEVKTLLADKQAAAQKALEDRGEYDRILESVKTKHEEERAALKAQIEELSGEKLSLVGTIDEMTVGRSFSESNFIRENSVVPASIARKEFSSHFEYKDGKLVGYDKPASASDRTPLVDGEANYLSFEDAIKTLYEKHPDSKSLIRSQAKPGSGAKPTSEPSSSTQKSSAPEQRGLGRIQAALQSSK